MRTMLSIDWDFFVWNGSHDSKIPYVDPQTKLPATTSGMLLFDWGHSEGHSAILQNVMWMSRAAHWKCLGLDIEEQVKVREDKGCVQPATFWSQVKKRVSFIPSPPLFVADSHAFGFWAVEELRYTKAARGKISVIHFDAHNDLGYGRKLGDDVECGNWLGQALRHRLVSEVTVVYPDWLGLREWEASGNDFRGRVTATTWSEWLRRVPRRHEVHGINVCRSSSWTPPWLDGEFADFVKLLPGPAHCFDCNGTERIGAYNACEPRTWDRSAFLEMMAGELAVPGKIEEANAAADNHRRCGARTQRTAKRRASANPKADGA